MSHGTVYGWGKNYSKKWYNVIDCGWYRSDGVGGGMRFVEPLA